MELLKKKKKYLQTLLRLYDFYLKTQLAFNGKFETDFTDVFLIVTKMIIRQCKSCQKRLYVSCRFKIPHDTFGLIHSPFMLSNIFLLFINLKILYELKLKKKEEKTSLLYILLFNYEQIRNNCMMDFMDD